MPGKSAFVGFVARTEIEFSGNVFPGELQKMGEQHLAGRIVPAIQIKGVLIEQELSIYQKAEVPREGTTIQLQSLETQPAARIELLNNGSEELLKLRPGTTAFPSEQHAPSNVMEKKIVEMLLGLCLCQEAAKRNYASFLQLIVAPPRVPLPQQRVEDLLAIFPEKNHLIAARADQFHTLAQAARQLVTVTHDPTIFRKVLKDALIPVLDRLKQRSQRNRENLFLSSLLTQEVGVIGFGHPEELHDIAALHQGKNANDLVAFKDDWSAKREIMTVGLPPGSSPFKGLKNLRSAVRLP
ncbi:MAG: hypothetical protein WA254_13630 [Candidatus Sulfotelmatobacter sp.]